MCVLMLFNNRDKLNYEVRCAVCVLFHVRMIERCHCDCTGFIDLGVELNFHSPEVSQQYDEDSVFLGYDAV